MKSRILSLTLLATMVGATWAWAQFQDTTVNAQSGSKGQASSSSSSSGSSRAGANAAAGGGFKGFAISGGMINGQHVYVVDYGERSANARATDASIDSAKSHDSIYTAQLSKEGVLVISGQYMDTGMRTMTILAIDDEVATKLALNSPLVKSGFWTAKVRPFNVSGLAGSKSPSEQPAPDKPPVLPAGVDTVGGPKP